MEILSNFIKMIGGFIEQNQWVTFLFGGIVGFMLNYFLQPYVKKSAENIADIQFTKLEAYLEEKGKNNATKEDIKDITKEIETVKSEISFANQRKQERIHDREKCLIDIAYYASLIGNMDFRLKTYLTYQLDRNKIDKFLEDLEGYSANLIYNRNCSKISIKDDELTNSIDELINAMRQYIIALAAKAANAGLIIDTCVDMEKSKETFNYSNAEKIKLYETIIQKKEELHDMMKEPINYKKEFQEAFGLYLKILKKYFYFELQ